MFSRTLCTVKEKFGQWANSVLLVHLVEIRDLITKNQWMDLSQYSNPLASIYTTIRRMKESGEVEEIEKDGDKAYKLKMAARTRFPKQPTLTEEQKKKMMHDAFSVWNPPKK